MAAPQTPAANPYAAPKAAVDDADDAPQPVKVFAVSGRIGRVRYINNLIGFYILFALVVGALSFVVGPLAQLLWLGYMVLAFMLTIQRCHDFNTTGWLSILSLVPLVNLMFWFIPGSDGRNRYGPPTPPNGIVSVVLVWFVPILMVAVLAAAAIPAYQTYVKRAQQLEQRR
ncbi:MAG TPA: DUF805 domain-containing protein [Burkholderiales bacterium]